MSWFKTVLIKINIHWKVQELKWAPAGTHRGTTTDESLQKKNSTGDEGHPLSSCVFQENLHGLRAGTSLGALELPQNTKRENLFRHWVKAWLLEGPLMLEAFLQAFTLS